MQLKVSSTKCGTLCFDPIYWLAYICHHNSVTWWVFSHLISNIHKIRVLIPSVKIRCHENSFGELTSLFNCWYYDCFSPHWVCRCLINTLRPRQNGRHFADDIFKCIFLNENVWIPIKLSLKFVPKGPIYNIPALVQIMAWRHPGDKSLSEPMMVNLTTHICVTRPQWVNLTVQATCRHTDNHKIWHVYFKVSVTIYGFQ